MNLNGALDGECMKAEAVLILLEPSVVSSR